MEKCIILTGGGTAGHTTLNIKLKDELAKYFDKIVYIGSKTGIEKELIKNNTNFIYEEISTVKLDRSKFFSNLAIPFKLNKAIKDAKKIIKKYNPSVIFSKGGYVGLPVTIAGKKLDVPVICHESDLTMGLANKLAKKYAKIICTNFEKTAKIDKKKCKYTGMPLILSKKTKSEAKKELKIMSAKPVLLVTGGSLGAKALNDFIFNNIDMLTKSFYVLHLTGKNNSNPNIVNPSYTQIEFCNNMPLIFKASDYAISRAGANTCIELLSNQILTIFVPLEKGSRGDQVQNAEHLKNENLCYLIREPNLNLQNFYNAIDYLQKNAKTIKNNIKNAQITDGTQKIIKIILDNSK